MSEYAIEFSRNTSVREKHRAYLIIIYPGEKPEVAKNYGLSATFLNRDFVGQGNWHGCYPGIITSDKSLEDIAQKFSEITAGGIVFRTANQVKYAVIACKRLDEEKTLVSLRPDIKFRKTF